MKRNNNAKEHVKLYKSKKKWVAATVFTATIGVMGVSVVSSVNADNVNQTNTRSNSTSQVTTLSSQRSNTVSLHSNSIVNSSKGKQSTQSPNSNSKKALLESQASQKKQVLNNKQNQQSSSQNLLNNYSKGSGISKVKQRQDNKTALVTNQPKKTTVIQSQLAIKPQTHDNQNKIMYATCNELNQVIVNIKQPLSGNLKNQVKINNGDGIKSVFQNGTQLTMITNSDICFQKPITISINGQQYTIDPTDGSQMAVVRSQGFDNKYVYNGNDLGATYEPQETTFKFYAPTASNVLLNLFDNDTNPNAALKNSVPMKFDPNTGVWSIIVKGNLKDTAYNYNEQFANGKSYDVYDPYATACVEGGFRSVVLSPQEMGSAVTPGKVIDKNDPTNEIIGEIDVRDFTNDPSSGVDSKLRGTYLGAVQPNTTDAKGNPTGLNYLEHQGINTVQIQPMFQYDDDGNNTNSTYEYDWGYDPENYNVPEGWYSTNRDDPAIRIRECKAMIQGFHNAGIRVNMDVVYNHVADHGTNALAKSVPGYYFIYGTNGKLTSTSGCGNDIASWRPMARKYILHSVKYWHDEYGIDGFRFDLMGNLDVTTMNDIRKELPNAVIYGEGWNMGTPVPNNQNADQANEHEMPTIGTFNGWGRTVLRGDDNGKPYGYVTGNQSQQTMSQLGNFIFGCQNMKNTPSDAVDGGVNYDNPAQVINYAECHDNRTLFDVMKAAYPNEPDNVLMRRAELANAISILNEGVPNVQVGQGFGRSKDGNENSYRAGDRINNIHWNSQDGRTWATAYEKALIQLRNSDPAFRMTTYSDMDNNMKWIEIGSNNGVIGYELTSPSTGKRYIIAYSNNALKQELTGIPNGKWKILIKDCNGYLNNPQVINITDGKTDIPSLSCLVLEYDPINSESLRKTKLTTDNHQIQNKNNDSHLISHINKSSNNEPLNVIELSNNQNNSALKASDAHAINPNESTGKSREEDLVSVYKESNENANSVKRYSKNKLPITGETHDKETAILGAEIASLGLALGGLSLLKRKKKY